MLFFWTFLESRISRMMELTFNFSISLQNKDTANKDVHLPYISQGSARPKQKAQNDKSETVKMKVNVAKILL